MSALFVAKSCEMEQVSKSIVWVARAGAYRGTPWHRTHSYECGVEVPEDWDWNSLTATTLRR